MRVFAYGRLHAVPVRTWERVLRQHGGERAKRARGAELVVIGAGAATRPKAQISEDVIQFRRDGQQVLSERAFLRRIGLLPDLAGEPRSFTASDVATRSKLSDEVVELLALFDVVESDRAGLFGFRDLKAAIQAARLLQFASLADLVLACNQIRDVLGVASPLSELNLQGDAGGRIVLGAGDRVADLTGQMRLDLEQDAPMTSGLLAEAEEARDSGDSKHAEQLLRRALAVSPKNLNALFELGSLLCEQEQFPEGVALLRKATLLRPRFADAWYNIGHALEQQGRQTEARDAYERAIEADPTYPDPHYNLGMIELDAERFSMAVLRLEAYLRLDAKSEWAAKARKALALARMSAVRASATNKAS